MDRMFEIAAVSKITGISIANLRNWERRYTFLVPRRSSRGVRFYSYSDVDLLNQITALVGDGRRICDIAEMISKQIPLPTPLKVAKFIAPELRHQICEFYEALLNYDQQRVEYLELALSVSLSLAQKLEFVYEPILKKIGDDWSSGKIGIAEERVCSNYLRHRISGFLSMPSAGLLKPAPSALCCTIEGERHEGGILALSAYLKLRGWVLHYFGIELPILELKRVAHRLKPSVTALSFCDSKLLQKMLPELIVMDIPIVVGGTAAQDSVFFEKNLKKVKLIQSSGQLAVDELESHILSSADCAII